MSYQTMLKVFAVIAAHLDPFAAWRLNHVRKAYIRSQRAYRAAGL